MFFFYLISLLVIFLIILILFTTIQINIENVKISTEKVNGRNINPKYKITIKLYIFKKINYLKLYITKNKIEKKVIQKNIDKLKEKIEKNKNKFDIRILVNLKKINLKIQKINLKVYLGIEDAATNAITAGMLSSSIAIIMGILVDRNILVLSSQNEKQEKNSVYWKITPIYQNKNLLNIDLNCIISFKLIHIIDIIFLNWGRFSNEKNKKSNKK